MDNGNQEIACCLNRLSLFNRGKHRFLGDYVGEPFSGVACKYLDRFIANCAERFDGRDFVETIKEIGTIVDGPISAEVISLEGDKMVAEAKELYEKFWKK